ncbi:MAG: hypothetical protein IKZ82_10290 [Clostridia bacterium]|nr:hypothetical protein [Clostridia bacterium]
MDIKRIDGYTDNRFSKTVLDQHGAYLIEDEPYEIEVIGETEASVRGKDPSCYEELIEYFRFHAPHISRFFDETGAAVAEFPAAELVRIKLKSIQPSQFFIDETKLAAVQSFIRSADDIIIQVKPYGERFISLDGHTRLYHAVKSGFSSVRAVVSDSDEWVFKFVHEAERRGVIEPKDMVLLPHEKYVVEWDEYCDSVFAEEAE